MKPLNIEKMIITDAGHMPVVKACAEKIDLVETINRMVETKMELSPGMAISVMVITMDHHRQPARPLKAFQLEYLKALGVTVDVFTVP